MRIYLDFEKPVAEIEAQVEELRALQTGETGPAIAEEIARLEAKAAETLEDTLRAGRVPVNIIRGTMDAVGKAGRLLEKVAAAGKAAVEEASKKSADKEKVEETPPGQ